MEHWRGYLRQYCWIYLLIGIFFIGSALFADRAVETMAAAEIAENTTRIVLDPGHGGQDGGAISCTGIPESRLNLEIAQRLDALFHLLGYRTTMIRTTDADVHTEGETIAQQKMSDLRNRVSMVNGTPNALLISIHQNMFQESQYHGPQVFYANTEGSQALAEQLQSAMVTALDPDSKRMAKMAEGVYLMQKINCTGVLVECGFLSNTEEEAKLRTPEYQKQLCCVIAAVVSARFHP